MWQELQTLSCSDNLQGGHFDAKNHRKFDVINLIFLKILIGLQLHPGQDYSEAYFHWSPTENVSLTSNWELIFRSNLWQVWGRSANFAKFWTKKRTLGPHLCWFMNSNLLLITKQIVYYYTCPIYWEIRDFRVNIFVFSSPCLPDESKQM